MTVPVSGRPYDVTIGSGVLAEAGREVVALAGASVAYVVSDAAVSKVWFGPLAASLEEAGVAAVLLTVPAGEEAKTLEVYGRVLRDLAAHEAHRDDPILALGGGAVGDLGGFVASTYMRGVPFLQLPTTLTGQIDAAIGGKTGVNLPEGKNLAGTFAQPRAVLDDLDVLKTLDERTFRSGLAEMAKYALTLDPYLLARLETDPGPVLARDPVVLEDVIARCVEAKARTVAADERDAGARLVLNYGHTLGHALERLEAFAGRTHGEAVAVGLVFAARLAEGRGLAANLTARTQRLLGAFGLDAGGSLPPPEEIMRSLRLDKKFRGGVRFVLLEDVGRPVVVDDVAEEEILAVLEDMGVAA